MQLGYFTMPLHPFSRDPLVTLQEDREAIILADKLGFHDAFVGEHLTDSAENVTNSFIFLATLISETKTILLGTGTSNLSHTHPTLVASHAAMFDHLAKGRFIFGISPGALSSDAEALGPGGEGVVLHLFSRCEKAAHRAEVVGVCPAVVPVEEGVGGQENGAVFVVEDVWNDPIVQGRGVEEDVGASDQTEQRAHRQSEAVEDRERVEDPVGVVQVVDRKHLADVGQQIAVGKHHALGHAFGAAGEKHHGGGVRVDLFADEFFRRKPGLCHAGDPVRG